MACFRAARLICTRVARMFPWLRFQSGSGSENPTTAVTSSVSSIFRYAGAQRHIGNDRRLLPCERRFALRHFCSKARQPRVGWQPAGEDVEDAVAGVASRSPATEANRGRLDPHCAASRCRPANTLRRASSRSIRANRAPCRSAFSPGSMLSRLPPVFRPPERTRSPTARVPRPARPGAGPRADRRNARPSFERPRAS